MSEDSHIPEIDPELEARVVALVAGEASDFEREELRRVIESRPELAAFESEMRSVHELLQNVGSGEFVSDETDWKLSEDRRASILAAIRGESVELPSKDKDAAASPIVRLAQSGWGWKLTKIAAAVGGIGVLGLLVMVSRSYQYASKAPMRSVSRMVDSVDEEYERRIPEATNGLSESRADAASMGRYVDMGTEVDAEVPYTLAVPQDGYALGDSGVVAGKAIRGEDEESAAVVTNDSKTALLAIRDTLESDFGTTPKSGGNARSWGTASSGPESSGFENLNTTELYLRDDVQYYPTGPAARIAREVDTPEVVADSSAPSSSSATFSQGGYPIAPPVVPSYAVPSSQTATPSDGAATRWMVEADDKPSRIDAGVSEFSLALPDMPGDAPVTSAPGAEGMVMEMEMFDYDVAGAAESDASPPDPQAERMRQKIDSLSSQLGELRDEDVAKSGSQRSVQFADDWRKLESPAAAEFSAPKSDVNFSNGVPILSKSLGDQNGSQASEGQSSSPQSADAISGGMMGGMGGGGGLGGRYGGAQFGDQSGSSEVELSYSTMAGDKIVRDHFSGDQSGEGDSAEQKKLALPVQLDDAEQGLADSFGAVVAGQSGEASSRPSRSSRSLGELNRFHVDESSPEPTSGPMAEPTQPSRRGRIVLGGEIDSGTMPEEESEPQGKPMEGLGLNELTPEQMQRGQAVPQKSKMGDGEWRDRSGAINQPYEASQPHLSWDSEKLAESSSPERYRNSAEEYFESLVPQEKKEAAKEGRVDDAVVKGKASFYREKIQATREELEMLGEEQTNLRSSLRREQAARRSELSVAKSPTVEKDSFGRREYRQTESLRSKRLAAPSGLNENTADKEAFSTFSLHVSDVSFKLALSALARGEWPEAAKVRIEEFVNALDYGDPLPGANEKVACRMEQSIHPFLQQRNLLRVSMRTAAAGRASTTPLRLTLVLDNSGSMERVDRRQTVRRAFALLSQQLKPMDQVTLISFARQPRLLADNVSGSKSNQLASLIANLPSEGGTNMEAALQLAFEKALEQQTEGAQNRVILLTDGAVNLGNADPESLSRMIETMRGQGIAFDAAGIVAEGLNDEVLEALTRKGDGRYYLLDSLDAADEGFARQIAGALRPSAKNVKVQVEFNPNRVGRYKLLGFEKHRLKKEDFRNDKVDAAEMAAAEAGVAMYQFEAKPDGEGDVGSVSVRFRDLSSGQMVEHRWPIPYEADPPRVDQASTSLRIASSAALLASKLKGGPLGETVDLRELSGWMSELPAHCLDNQRIGQLRMMIDQARQLSGK